MTPHARAADTRLIALIVGCAGFMVALDASVIGVAVPDMARAFAVRPVDLSLGITSYILAQAVLLPGSGWLAERLGPRRVLALALAGFSAASILCGLSHTLPQFIAARVVQGAAGSLVAPVARMVLVQAAGKENLVRAITISFLPAMIAPMLGPPIGGLITAYLSWSWIFLLNVPFGVVSIILILRFIAPTLSAEPRPFDLKGFTLVALASGSALVGLDQVSASGPAWARGSILVLVGAVLGIAAVRYLARAANPVFSLSPAQLRSFSATTLSGGFLVRLPLRALPFVLPLLFEVGLGMSPVRSGVLLLAMSAGDLILTPAATNVLRRFGFRRVLVQSTVLTLATILGCAAFPTRYSYAGLFALLAVSGMVQAPLWAGLNALAFADIPHEELAHATVLWNLVLQLTGALGISLAAILLNGSARLLGESASHVSVQDCQWTLAVLSLIGAGSVFFFRRLAHDAGAAVSGHGRRYGAVPEQ